MLIGKDDNDILIHFPRSLLTLCWFPHPSALHIERKEKVFTHKKYKISYNLWFLRSISLYLDCTHTHICTHPHVCARNTPFTVVTLFTIINFGSLSPFWIITDTSELTWLRKKWEGAWFSVYCISHGYFFSCTIQLFRAGLA